MEIHDIQLAPPKTWVKFEDLCLALFRAVWNSPLSQKNGRSGQPQHGVDIFGSLHSAAGVFHGVQCKGKAKLYGSKVTARELKAEIGKAESFVPRLASWTLATAAPTDAKIQQLAREITVERVEKGLFPIAILGWDDIQSLIAAYPNVAKEFYPEHTVHWPCLIEGLEQLPKAGALNELLAQVTSLLSRSELSSIDQVVSWEKIDLKESRDLGPALLGRALGPSDATACPELPEVGQVKGQLDRGYFARIVGEPGDGKSICMYQVAQKYAANGWTVVRASSKRLARVMLDRADSKTLYLIDDAHLLTNGTLSAAEERATGDRLVLSTHNASQHDRTFRGSVAIDARRAVKKIAAALRANRPETLRIVQCVDNRVGDGAHDDSLDDRLEHAEAQASRPWQFCFILGGGWRRAGDAVDAARAANADMFLAVAAINQVASRDANTSREKLKESIVIAGMALGDIDGAISWLVKERLLIDDSDLRTPHQLFAIVALNKVLKGQSKENRLVIGRVMQHVFCSEQYPLAGLRVLIHELRFLGEYRQWHYLVPGEKLQALVTRCWKVAEPQERNFAAMIFTELESFLSQWPYQLLNENKSLLGAWVSNPDDPSGYGVGRLLNDVRNKDEKFHQEIVEQADGVQIAKIVSAVTPKSAYALGTYLSALGHRDKGKWAKKFLGALNREALLALAKNWPRSESVQLFSHFCQSFLWWDAELALDLVENFVPSASDAFAKDPVTAITELDDIVHGTLGILDILGVRVGKHRPEKRCWDLARSICKNLDPKSLGGKISASRRRQFQAAAYFLIFLGRASPSKFGATVAALDLDKIALEIGDAWRNLSHESEILLSVIFQSKPMREKIRTVTEKHLDRIELMPPRIALMAPELAYKHVEAGRRIRIAHNTHVEWRFAWGVLAFFLRDRPQMAAQLVEPAETAIGRTLSQKHISWYGEAYNMLILLKERLPDTFQRILGAVDPKTAEEGWSSCLQHAGPTRQVASVLVEGAIGRGDAIGDVGRRIRKRFPTRSLLRISKKEALKALLAEV